MTQEQLTKLTTDEQISYWIGRLLIAIGKGDLRSEVYFMMDFYQRIAYERGVNSTKGQ